MTPGTLCSLPLLIAGGFQAVAVVTHECPAEVHTVPFEFTLENGWVFDGKIELPPTEQRNGFAAMLLGGGLGGPIDWMVPGIMTLDGRPTRDGDLIAPALLAEGFIVLP